MNSGQDKEPGLNMDMEYNCEPILSKDQDGESNTTESDTVDTESKDCEKTEAETTQDPVAETRADSPLSTSSLLSENLDKGEEADAESEMSDNDLPPSSEPQAAAESAGKKRKKHDPNKRRKIRKMLTEDKLNKQTLLAVQEEEMRRKRLEEQALNRAQLESELKPNANQFQFPAASLLPPSGAMSCLANLLTSTDRHDDRKGTPLLAKPLPAKFATKQPNKDVICISSDSSDEERSKKAADAIDVSSDNSSDDVICTGEVKEEAPGMEETNNSGMHTDDTMNQPDSQGRVLVNVNRPSNEPEIFLAPQLAKAVHPHQIGGIRFMFDNLVETLSHHETSAGFGCILAHAMGLGKTLQVISFVDVFLRFTNARTVLCVVPVNTLMNWVAEFDMWLPRKSQCMNENPAAVWPRSFTVHVLTECHKSVQSRSKVVTQWYEEGGVLLLGYEMYRLLASKKGRKTRSRRPRRRPEDPIDIDQQGHISNLQNGMQGSLLKPGPDLIICDEGHRIKNSHANISKVLKSVRTKRRLVLTGYPLQNNLMEYWCMVDFVRPNFLGTKNEFSNMFERPILNGQCKNSTTDDIRLMRFRSHVLHSLLKGFVQRRSHSVLRNTLPLKEEHVIMIRMSEWQKKLYNHFMRTMEGGSGSWGSTVNPIRAFSICCKIWNHPDVLHRVVCEKTDKQEDDDLDIPDPITASQNSTNGGGTASAKSSPPRPTDKPAVTTTPCVTPVGTPIGTPTGTPNGTPTGTPTGTPIAPSLPTFPDDKEKGISYEWAKDLLAGYTPGFVELSGKMVILMQVIRASVECGDKILVFSQSLCTLSLIEEFLQKYYVPRPDQPPRKWAKNQSYFRLDGNTHSADRERMINQFNAEDNNDVWLFLLSTRAGCLGINLIGANRVVVFDASWNPCHDAQAVCRVYRYGQQKNCSIYRFVCDQSMEKKIYERQVSKQGMSDRVVDKLNPTAVFTRQDVMKLLEYSEVELPRVAFDAELPYNDPVLVETCHMSGHWMTQKPFCHESLLLDCKDQRLTKAEMRIAQKGYERDKLASSTYNYSRPSYAGFYGSSNSPSLSKSASTNSMSSAFPSSLSRDGIRPIANVRPMQITPNPKQLRAAALPGAAGPMTISRSGISVQKVVASQEIPLPPQRTPGINTTAQLSSSIKLGETYFVIHGNKATYIRTGTGRIFALKSNDVARFGASPAVTPAPALASERSAQTAMTPSVTESPFRRNQSEPNMSALQNPFASRRDSPDPSQQPGIYPKTAGVGGMLGYPNFAQSPSSLGPHYGRPPMFSTGSLASTNRVLTSDHVGASTTNQSSSGDHVMLAKLLGEYDDGSTSSSIPPAPNHYSSLIDSPAPIDVTSSGIGERRASLNSLTDPTFSGALQQPQQNQQQTYNTLGGRLSDSPLANLNDFLTQNNYFTPGNSPFNSFPLSNNHATTTISASSNQNLPGGGYPLDFGAFTSSLDRIGGYPLQFPRPAASLANHNDAPLASAQPEAITISDDQENGLLDLSRKSAPFSLDFDQTY